MATPGCLVLGMELDDTTAGIPQMPTFVEGVTGVGRGECRDRLCFFFFVCFGDPLIRGWTVVHFVPSVKQNRGWTVVKYKNMYSILGTKFASTWTGSYTHYLVVPRFDGHDPP